MNRLEEIDGLIWYNFQLVEQYSKRAAELLGSIRTLEKERAEIMKRGTENACKDKTGYNG